MLKKFMPYCRFASQIAMVTRQNGVIIKAQVCYSEPGTHLFSEKAAVVDRGQISVMDLDQLVQIFRLLHLVLKLQACAV